MLYSANLWIATHQMKHSVHHLLVPDLLDLQEANEDPELEAVLDVHLDNLLRPLDLGQCDLVRPLNLLLASIRGQGGGRHSASVLHLHQTSG